MSQGINSTRVCVDVRGYEMFIHVNILKKIPPFEIVIKNMPQDDDMMIHVSVCDPKLFNMFLNYVALPTYSIPLKHLENIARVCEYFSYPFDQQMLSKCITITKKIGDLKSFFPIRNSYPYHKIHSIKIIKVPATLCFCGRMNVIGDWCKCNDICTDFLSSVSIHGRDSQSKISGDLMIENYVALEDGFRLSYDALNQDNLHNVINNYFTTLKRTDAELDLLVQKCLEMIDQWKTVITLYHRGVSPDL